MYTNITEKKNAKSIHKQLTKFENNISFLIPPRIKLLPHTQWNMKWIKLYNNNFGFNLHQQFSIDLEETTTTTNIF